MQNHHLNKLTITSSTTSESEGFALRRLLKDNWQQLLPELTTSFDDVCAEDDVIYLPKISISLEVDSLDSLVSEMPNNHNQTLKDQIITQLMQQIQQFKTKPNIRKSGSYLHSELLDANTKSQYIAEFRNNTKTNKQSVDLLTWQDVKSYLNSGKLPWYIMHEESTKNLLKRENSQPVYLSMQSLLKHNINECIDGLYEEHSAQKVNRVIQLCDDVLLKSILEYLVEQALHKVKLSTSKGVGDVQQQSRALVVICEEIINKSVNPIGFTNALFTMLISDQTEINTVYSETIQDRMIENLIPKTAKHFNISEDLLSILISEILPQTDVSHNTKNQHTTQSMELDKGKSLDKKSDDDLFKNTTRVLFAGSILLYPYLSRLFKELDYLSEDKKIKTSKQNSAVALMLYLLTGKEQAFDYQLHFVKWLLGIPADVLISTEKNSLDEKEIAEADNVLSSLKSHWSVLKNSSFTTIRESFLQRSGMMKIDDEQCHLHIERKGIDVLIDQIPFSLSIIRLAWIKQPIIVTW